MRNFREYYAYFVLRHKRINDIMDIKKIRRSQLMKELEERLRILRESVKLSQVKMQEKNAAIIGSMIITEVDIRE